MKAGVKKMIKNKSWGESNNLLLLCEYYIIIKKSNCSRIMSILKQSNYKYFISGIWLYNPDYMKSVSTQLWWLMQGLHSKPVTSSDMFNRCPWSYLLWFIAAIHGGISQCSGLVSTQICCIINGDYVSNTNVTFTDGYNKCQEILFVLNVT